MSTEWLWTNRAPFGGITMIDGDPGKGKTMMCLDLVARATRGELPVKGSTPLPALVISAEDDLARTIVPRLRVAGADLGRVFTHAADNEHAAVWNLAEDMLRLELLIEQNGIRVLLLDPLVAFLPIDTHKDGEVRRLLRPLNELAQRRQVAVLAIRHLRKGGEGSALHRGGGSIAFVGAARAAHLVAPHPTNPKQVVVAPTKCNVGAMPSSLLFEMDLPYPPDPAAPPRVRWVGTCDLTADELVGTAGRRTSEKAEGAAEWLRGQLAAGPVLVSALRLRAEQAKISWRTVERAKDLVGVESAGPNASRAWSLT